MILLALQHGSHLLQQTCIRRVCTLYPEFCISTTAGNYSLLKESIDTKNRTTERERERRMKKQIEKKKSNIACLPFIMYYSMKGNNFMH